jgi:hypothetical protein
MGRYTDILHKRLRKRYEKVTQATPIDLQPSDYPRGLHPLKGKKDGRCNRTACQKPLAGKTQFFRREHGYDDLKLYYCATCALDFNAYDHRMGWPPRCERVEESADDDVEESPPSI